MPVRDTPTDLEASVNLPVGSAADAAAILCPSVGATPTRAPVTGIEPIVDNALMDSSRIRAEVVSPSLPQGQHLLRDMGVAKTPTLTHVTRLGPITIAYFDSDIT